jgi:hypothetical protein
MLWAGRLRTGWLKSGNQIHDIGDAPLRNFRPWPSENGEADELGRQADQKRGEAALAEWRRARRISAKRIEQCQQGPTARGALNEPRPTNGEAVDKMEAKAEQEIISKLTAPWRMLR